MKLCFFNVQRLGEATEDSRRRRIFSLAEKNGCGLVVMCELTTGCKLPTPYNLTHRQKKVRQLCYGARYIAGPAPVAIQQVDPWVTDAFLQPGSDMSFYKGGTNFKTLASRALGRLIPPPSVGKVWPAPAVGIYGVKGGVDIYCFHAPAKTNAARKAVSFVACWLETYYGAGGDAAADGRPPYYLLVGDMNLEPGQLLSSKAYTVNNLPDRTVSGGKPTHSGRGRERELDWALSNMPNAAVTTFRASKRFKDSDHLPIYVSY